MTTIDVIESTDNWTVSLAKINTNFDNIKNDKIETSTIVTNIPDNGNDTEIATTKAIVDKIWALWGGNVSNSVGGADNDPVVLDWVTGNTVKPESRKTAFNKNFWSLWHARF